MMKTNKRRKSRIRLKKLVFFIVAVLAVLALLVFGMTKTVHHLSARSAEEAGQPMYYLFIGTDEKAGNEADTVLLMARNDKKEQAVFISIPSNTKIPHRQEGKYMLLRQTLSEGGSEETKSAIENLLHIRIDKYAVINFANFKNYMSHWGPVDMYVEKSMEHSDANGVSDIEIYQGYQSLQADAGLGYVRYIDTENGEVGRIQRQERFMKTVLEKMQASSSIYNWAAVKYYWSAVETDISSEEAGNLAYHLTKFPPSNCKFIIFPGELQKSGKEPAWVVNPVEAQKVIAMTME